MKKIGLLGCGAIGMQIAQAIDSGTIPAKLVSVYDQDEKRASALIAKLSDKPRMAQNAHMLSSEDVDLVVEAASQDAVRGVALSVLQNRRDLMIMSSGALLDESVFDVLQDACAEFNRTIYCKFCRNCARIDACAICIPSLAPHPSRPIFFILLCASARGN